jgi:hypothetical protein
MEKLEREYQHSLWPSPSRDRLNPASSAETGVHFINAGSVCIYQLSPVVSNERLSNRDDFTIQEYQFQLLETILKSGSATSLSALSMAAAADGTHRAPRQALLTSVVVMSPLQLVFPVDDGTGAAATAHATAGSRGLQYVDGVAQRLLDLLVDWATGKFGTSGKDDTGPDCKEVIFVCPSTDKGMTMRLRCFNLEDMVPQRGADVSEPINPNEFYPASTFLRYKPAAVFKQLCCGPSVGIPCRSGDVHDEQPVGEEEDEGSAEETKSAVVKSGAKSSKGDDKKPPPVKVDASMRSRFPLYSPSGRVFVCSVDSVVADPHCGMLVVGGDVKARRAALKEAHVQLVTDKKSHRDMHSARSNKSSRKGSFDHSSEEKEKQTRLELKLSTDASLLTRQTLKALTSLLVTQEERRVPMNVQDVWKAVCKLLMQHPVKKTGGEDRDTEEQTSGPFDITLTPDTFILDRAAREICRRCEKLILNCFRMNQENLFGGGVLSGYGVGTEKTSLGGSCSPGIVAMLLNIMDWLLNEMPSAFRAVFSPPSPLLMKWYWHFFSVNICQELVAGFGADKKITVSPSEVILMTLREDYDLFSAMCINGLRCSALFIQIAGHNKLSNR